MPAASLRCSPAQTRLGEDQGKALAGPNIVDDLATMQATADGQRGFMLNTVSAFVWKNWRFSSKPIGKLSWTRTSSATY